MAETIMKSRRFSAILMISVSLMLATWSLASAGPFFTGQEAMMPAAAQSQEEETTATTNTTTAEEQEQRIIDRQETVTEQLTPALQQVGGVEFTPRWGEVAFVEPGELSVLFADCLEDEFAVSEQYILGSSVMSVRESFAVAMSDDSMSWLIVAKNSHDNETLPASAGVICAGETDGPRGVGLSNEAKTEINNIVNNVVQVEGDQIVNLNQVFNIRQTIIQQAIQIINVTGNNNTVNAVINQTAQQVASQNITDPADIEQVIRQEAEQEVDVELPAPGNVTAPPEEEEDNCDSAYPDACIPPYPPDLDCGDISEKNFEVGSSDPHRFDNDNDGIGCETTEEQEEGDEAASTTTTNNVTEEEVGEEQTTTAPQEQPNATTEQDEETASEEEGEEEAASTNVTEEEEEPATNATEEQAIP
jgi:hypothetical protein